MHSVFHRLTGIIGVIVATSGAHVAKADVISSTPTLPLLGVPYVSSVGAGCFATAGLCIADGSETLTSAASVFNPSGQDIVSNVLFSGQITTLGGSALGPVSLTGSLEQEVLGRVTSSQTGAWTTDIVALSLSGPVQGHTLTLGLDTSQTSAGMSSISPAGGGLFQISSFFDVFVELNLDSNPPLNATRGPLHFETAAATAVPEPRSLFTMLPALLGLGLVRWFGGKRRLT